MCERVPAYTVRGHMCVCVCVGGGERGGEEAPAETPDLTSKPEEERNYSEGVFPLLLPLPCG